MTLIRKPNEIQAPTSVKILIYGQPGIGKTTVGVSVPQPLLLDFDGGIHRINPIHVVDTVQIQSWEDCVNVLKEDLTPYRSLVIDTAGKMLDYMTNYIIKSDPKMGRKDGALTLQGYGVRKVMFINFLKQVSIMGKHIVVIAHDREERDGDNKIIRPEIGGSSAGDLIKEIDLVGYMEASGKKRTISFDPCEKFYGKNTCNLEAIIEIPESGANNIFLSTIISIYLESLEQRKEIAGQYVKLMSVISENIEKCETEIDLNNFIDGINSYHHVWGSKIETSHLIRDRASVLNLTFNRELHKYEAPVADKKTAKQSSKTA
jgi:hypothetical protein